MTTLERILREEFTMAAHVSSAEDSTARTVNLRAFCAVARRREVVRNIGVLMNIISPSC